MTRQVRALFANGKLIVRGKNVRSVCLETVLFRFSPLSNRVLVNRITNARRSRNCHSAARPPTTRSYGERRLFAAYEPVSHSISFGLDDRHLSTTKTRSAHGGYQLETTSRRKSSFQILFRPSVCVRVTRIIPAAEMSNRDGRDEKRTKNVS